MKNYDYSRGIELIKKYEGLRTTAYKCPAGVWTIGYGHTSGVKEGDSITVEKAEQYLTQDIEKITKNNAFINFCEFYNLNDNEASAMLSFCYNGGIGWLRQVSASNTRSKETIGEKMKLYNKANGTVLQGLVNRRKAESELFFTPVSLTKQGDYMEVSFYNGNGKLKSCYRIDM